MLSHHLFYSSDELCCRIVLSLSLYLSTPHSYTNRKIHYHQHLVMSTSPLLSYKPTAHRGHEVLLLLSSKHGLAACACVYIWLLYHSIQVAHRINKNSISSALKYCCSKIVLQKGAVSMQMYSHKILVSSKSILVLFGRGEMFDLYWYDKNNNCISLVI